MSPEAAREARLARGFTQQEVATWIGVPLRSYMKWEHGDVRLRAEVVDALEKMLRTPPDYPPDE